jgi:hypothetical protein
VFGVSNGHANSTETPIFASLSPPSMPQSSSNSFLCSLLQAQIPALSNFKDAELLCLDLYDNVIECHDWNDLPATCKIHVVRVVEPVQPEYRLYLY